MSTMAQPPEAGYSSPSRISSVLARFEDNIDRNKERGMVESRMYLTTAGSPLKRQGSNTSDATPKSTPVGRRTYVRQGSGPTTPPSLTSAPVVDVTPEQRSKQPDYGYGEEAALDYGYGLTTSKRRDNTSDHHESFTTSSTVDEDDDGLGSTSHSKEKTKKKKSKDKKKSKTDKESSSKRKPKGQKTSRRSSIGVSQPSAVIDSASNIKPSKVSRRSSLATSAPSASSESLAVRDTTPLSPVPEAQFTEQALSQSMHLPETSEEQKKHQREAKKLSQTLHTATVSDKKVSKRKTSRRSSIATSSVPVAEGQPVKTKASRRSSLGVIPSSPTKVPPPTAEATESERKQRKKVEKQLSKSLHVEEKKRRKEEKKLSKSAHASLAVDGTTQPSKVSRRSSLGATMPAAPTEPTESQPPRSKKASRRSSIATSVPIAPAAAAAPPSSEAVDDKPKRKTKRRSSIATSVVAPESTPAEQLDKKDAHMKPTPRPTPVTSATPESATSESAAPKPKKASRRSSLATSVVVPPAASETADKKIDRKKAKRRSSIATSVPSEPEPTDTKPVSKKAIRRSSLASSVPAADEPTDKTSQARVKGATKSVVKSRDTDVDKTASVAHGNANRRGSLAGNFFAAAGRKAGRLARRASMTTAVIPEESSSSKPKAKPVVVEKEQQVQVAASRRESPATESKSAQIPSRGRSKERMESAISQSPKQNLTKQRDTKSRSSSRDNMNGPCSSPVASSDNNSDTIQALDRTPYGVSDPAISPKSRNGMFRNKKSSSPMGETCSTTSRDSVSMASSDAHPNPSRNRVRKSTKKQHRRRSRSPGPNEANMTPSPQKSPRRLGAAIAGVLGSLPFVNSPVKDSKDENARSPMKEKDPECVQDLPEVSEGYQQMSDSEQDSDSSLQLDPKAGMVSPAKAHHNAGVFEGLAQFNPTPNLSDETTELSKEGFTDVVKSPTKVQVSTSQGKESNSTRVMDKIAAFEKHAEPATATKIPSKSLPSSPTKYLRPDGLSLPVDSRFAYLGLSPRRLSVNLDALFNLAAIKIQAAVRGGILRLKLRCAKLEQDLAHIEARKGYDFVLLQMQQWQKMEKFTAKAISKMGRSSKTEKKYLQLEKKAKDLNQVIDHLKQENERIQKQNLKMNVITYSLEKMNKKAEKSNGIHNSNIETISAVMDPLTEKNERLVARCNRYKQRIDKQMASMAALRARTLQETKKREELETGLFDISAMVEERSDDERLKETVAAICKGEMETETPTATGTEGYDEGFMLQFCINDDDSQLSDVTSNYDVLEEKPLQEAEDLNGSDYFYEEVISDEEEEVSEDGSLHSFESSVWVEKSIIL